MDDLQQYYPELFSWLNEVGEKEFIFGNLLLTVIESTTAEDHCSYITAEGLLWISFGIYMFYTEDLESPEKFFDFFVVMFNIVLSSLTMKRLEEIEFKEVESFDYRKEWLLNIFEKILTEFLKTSDITVLKMAIKDTKMLYLLGLSNLKRLGKILDDFLTNKLGDHFVIGFSPIKVIKINGPAVFLNKKVINKLETMNLSEKHKEILRKVSIGRDFIQSYLKNLESIFAVFHNHLNTPSG